MPKSKQSTPSGIGRFFANPSNTVIANRSTVTVLNQWPPQFASMIGLPRLRIRRLLWALLCLGFLFSGVLASPSPQAWDARKIALGASSKGPQAVAGAHALIEMIGRTTARTDATKLQAVNDFFNRRVSFQEDAAVWGAEDYWASPLELLEKGRGDCEDYAIAKYFSLLALGIPVSKLRLVYAQARLGGPGSAAQAHLVLAYYGSPNGQELPSILDNLIDDIHPSSRRPDLTPVFSFNSESLWQGVGPQTAGDPTIRLSRWRDVLAKARMEGFL